MMRSSRQAGSDLGRRSSAGRIWAMVVSLFTTLGAFGQAPNPPTSLLTNLQQVIELGRDGARRNLRPVDLEAVSTLSLAGQPPYLWVQDKSVALMVVATNGLPVPAGLRVRVRGTAAPGLRMPVFIDAAQLDILGPGTLPEPVRLPVAHLFRPEFYGQWIEQEGVVRSVNRRGNTYLINLAADDAPVDTIFHADSPDENPALWLNRRLRMRGVCVTGMDAEGRVFGFELHVPGTNHVLEPRLTPTATSPPPPAELRPPLVPDEFSAASLTAALAWFQNRTNPPLSPANATNTLPVLTNVQQVLALGLAGARSRPHPVRILGVVTYPPPGSRQVYVDDGTGGILVTYAYTDNLPNRHPGQVVWVDGIAGAGPIKPWIAEARIKPLGTIPVPVPHSPPTADLSSGRWDGEWIEIEGAIRDLTRDSRLYLLVAAGNQHIEVVAPYSQQSPLPVGLLEARVALRGLCEVPVDFSGRPTQARLYLNQTNDIRVLRPGKTNPFDRPLSTPAAYRGRKTFSEERTKLAGTVLFQSGAGLLFLRDALGAVRAEPLAYLIRRGTRTVGLDRPPQEPLQPGDRIELVGAPSASALAPRLVDAEYQRLSPGSAPTPLRVSTAEAASGRHDADLLSLRARVVGRENRRLDEVDTEVLWLEDQGVVFEALYEAQGTNPLPATPRDTLVEATGICTALPQAEGHLRNFRLLMRDAADVTVLGRAAPWESLQPGRILAVSGGLGALALTWVLLLRRQVQRRTSQLRAANLELRGQIAERSRADQVQRATYQISEAVHAAGDLESFYRRIHEVIRSLMQAENFFLLLHNPTTDLYEYAYHVDRMDPWPPPRKVTAGLVGYVLNTGRPLLVDRHSMTNPAQEWHLVSGTPSAIWLGVPLIVQGKTIGVMAVQDYENPAAYGEAEKQILTYVAEQTALAIERKGVEAELARFAAIVESTSDCVVFARMDGPLLSLNVAGRRMLGLPERGPIQGRTFLDLVSPNSRAAMVDTLLPAALRDGTLSAEFKLRRSDDTELHGSSVMMVLRDAHGQPACLAAIIRDITERERILGETERALAHEKELSELKSRFVAMVSHEFRTPLGIITSSAEILEAYLNRLTEEDRRANLRDITDATRHMARMMEEVLLLGRVEAGHMTCRPGPLDLSIFGQRLVDEVTSTTNARCRIRFSAQESLPVALADESLLRHIFTNLLNNASKYSPVGSPIDFEVEARETMALFTVRDRGIGIPEADARLLFQAFHRGRNVGDTPGTGLGMSIVKRCVELHGGRLSFESQEGHGTTFTVLLPLLGAPTAHSRRPSLLDLLAHEVDTANTLIR